MHFKINWARVIVGSAVTVFALFYFVFESNFPSTSPRGAYIWRGDLTEGFLRYEFGGLIHGGAYFGILRYFFAQNMCITINKQLRRALVCLLFVLLPLLATEQTQWQERDRRDTHFFLTCHIYCLILLLQHQKCPI